MPRKTLTVFLADKDQHTFELPDIDLIVHKGSDPNDEPGKPTCTPGKNTEQTSVHNLVVPIPTQTAFADRRTDRDLY